MLTATILVLFGVLISGVRLENNRYEEFYKNVTVAFSRDPCDTQELKMPNFKAPDRRISVTTSYRNAKSVSWQYVFVGTVTTSHSQSPTPDINQFRNFPLFAECMEYIWRIRYKRGKIENKDKCFQVRTGMYPVTGGSAATPGEYPHMGALGWKAKVGTWIFKCGGSLISEKYVLTAAHCSSVPRTDKTVKYTTPQIVRLGAENIMDNFFGKLPYDIGIRRFIKHPRYEPPRQYYDIALVELKEEVPFRWDVHPSCLWTNFDQPSEGTLTGWGVVDAATLKTVPHLQKGKITIVDSEECNNTLYGRRTRKWDGVMRHQLCAGDKTGIVDSCQGDSGGPLQFTMEILEIRYLVSTWNLHSIVGVTSFGFGCAKKNTPSIYTRVASFIGWIENIVWPNNQNYEERFLFRT